MNYFLIANNNVLLKEPFYKIEDNDIIVTFNHGRPLFETNLLQKENKTIYHFCRRSFNKKIPYSGINQINSIKDKINKIFLYPHPESIGNKKQKEKIYNYITNNTNINISEISHMQNFGKNENTKRARQFLRERHNKISNMSMGLIGYLYIHQTKKEQDSVYIVGFSHQMNTNKHNPEGEKDFFDSEVEKGLCQRLIL
jgi:hypothetical protein